MSVLLVDHDAGLRSRLRAQLQDRGVHVTVAGTVAEAEAALALRSFVVVILELRLSDGLGLEVLDRLRASGSTSHVIMLSASTGESDHVGALERGADDFVVKPFYLRELTARVLAVRRRHDPAADTVVQVGPFHIDLLGREVTRGTATVELTPKEFDLLAYLAVRPGHVFDREQLLNAVWRSRSEWQAAATVTEHIRRLRKKLEADPAHPEILTTVRGAGYRLNLPAAGGEVDSEVAAAVAAPGPGEMVQVDGVIVFCDQPAADLVGAAAPDAVVGSQLVDFATDTSRAAARGRLVETGTAPARRSELMDLRRVDGGEISASVESSAARWHGQPARRLRMEAVTDATARLRQQVVGVLGDLSDAVIITDLHFHIRSWNQAAERLYGWTEEDVCGRHLLDVLPWVRGSELIPELWERLEQTGRWHGESTQVARDGSSVEVLSTTTLIRDGHGEPVAIVSVNRAAVDARRARSIEQDAALTARLRQGLADDEFQVFYQPVVNLLDDQLIMLEALVRWEHPERGTLLPAEFLDSAEASGVIVELGATVLDKACRQATEWRRSGADIHLSVNVSTRQLADPEIVERFTRIIRESGLEPTSLWLEVTETAIVEELDQANRALRRLVDLGVGVSIDDFGTGWASLTYLHSFPVHALKIDRRFAARAGRTANDTAIVRSILALGAELDLFVVAEGIETQEQHDELRRLGCFFGQGYLFGRPTPPGGVPLDRARRFSGDRPGPSGAAGPVALVPSAASSAGALSGHGGLAVLDVAPTPHRRPRSTPRSSGFGRVVTDAEGVESDVVADLLRGLLRVGSAAAAAQLLHSTIRDMGGVPVKATEAGEHALPLDVSLGEGPPMLVEVERLTVARIQLERLLPRLVEDARQAVDLLRQTERLVGATVRDALTGLANRRVLDRVLPRATSGSVVMIDLDHFKDVNDQHGHAAGDGVLVAFGEVLMTVVRAQDTSCRIGGEEFALVLTGADVDGAVELIDRIRTVWSKAPPLPVTFSAGVAQVGADGGTAALLAADRALYRAKALGRDRTELASPSVDQQEP
ncbi:MAG: EAL domain-containing protein [Acidimicrobiales bacterium]